MNNVIIFGGNGFIGKNLSKLHLERGDSVLSIDNYYSSKPDDEYAISLTIQYPKNYFRFSSDVCSTTFVTDVMHLVNTILLNGLFFSFENKFIVYNLACPASPKHYMRDPKFTLKTSFKGMENIINLVKDKLSVISPTTLVFTSTSEVYGDPLVHPQPESYFGNVNMYGPRACYDEGKRVAETMCYLYKNVVDVRVARLFNTYGPLMDADDGRVVSNFIVASLKNEPLVIFGDGTQTRSFCYVDDTVEALYMMGTNPDVPKASPINIGNPIEFDLLDLSKLVIDYTGSKSEVIFREAMQDDPKVRKPVIKTAKEVLGWEPKVNLETGLKNTIAYFSGC